MSSDECAAVATLYKKLNGNDLNLTSLLEIDCCSAAPFITCSSNNGETPLSVSKIAFPGLSLSGQIPNEVFAKLPSLYSLDLSKNLVTGALPIIPSLKILILAINDFTGDLNAIPLMNELRILDLGFNSLTGSIPFDISKNWKLKLISLQYNKVSGPIPVQVLQLPLLETFNVAHTMLESELPKVVAGFPSLVKLDLSSTGISGPLPADFPTSLRFLNVSNTRISGNLPKNLTTVSANGECAYVNTRLTIDENTTSLPTGCAGVIFSGSNIDESVFQNSKQNNATVGYGAAIALSITILFLVIATVSFWFWRKRQVALKKNQDQNPKDPIGQSHEFDNRLSMATNPGKQTRFSELESNTAPFSPEFETEEQRTNRFSMAPSVPASDIEEQSDK